MGLAEDASIPLALAVAQRVDFDRHEYRAGLRPTTPEGTPILGFGRHRNLCYNTGHGHMGWTMACGTAAIVSDLIAGRSPELSLDGLTPR